jgi:hypothetical protein
VDARKRYKRKDRNLEKQINELQLEVKRLKKALQVKTISSAKQKANHNLLTSLDPAKINDWITLFSNPAIMDLFKQFSSKPAQPAQAAVSRRRRRRFFLF